MKVRLSDISNFLGYKCKENGLIETKIKGGFEVTSDWPHLTLFLLGSESRVYHWGGDPPPCFFKLFVSLEQQNLVH